MYRYYLFYRTESSESSTWFRDSGPHPSQLLFFPSSRFIHEDLTVLVMYLLRNLQKTNWVTTNWY